MSFRKSNPSRPPHRSSRSPTPPTDRRRYGPRDFPQPENPTNPNRPAWHAHSPQQIDLVFFDLETTGGNPHNSAVMEIGAVRYENGVEVGRFETLVNPKRSIPPIVRKITGIDDNMVAGAPSLEEIFPAFMDFVGSAVLVSHGALGDLSFLAQASRNILDCELTNDYFCTHLIVSNFLSHIPSKSLTGVAEYFDLAVEGTAHSAMTDALVTAAIFWKIADACAQNGFRTCDDLLKIQADNETIRRLGPGLNPTVVEQVPTTAGVLYLLNSHHEVSFLSATPNMRRTLQAFTVLGNDRDMNRLIVDAAGYRFERFVSFLDALLYEKKWLHRVSLAIDPRKTQNRTGPFVQLFIPQDMIDYANKHPQDVPFPIPEHGERPRSRFETPAEDYIEHEQHLTHKSLSESALDAYANESTEPVTITRSRHFGALVRSQKFRMIRRHDGEVNVHVGHLKEGVGYAFGPFEESNPVVAQVQALVSQYPIDDTSLPIAVRFDHFHRVLRALQVSLGPQAEPRSGLAITSNTEKKEIEVFLVVRSRVVKKVHYPFEQSRRLYQVRTFTRLFDPYYDEIQSAASGVAPLLFTDDVCSDMELFAYWLKSRRGEGEFIDFSEVSGLFDRSALSLGV